MNMREKIARALAKGAFENMTAQDIPLNMDEQDFVDEMWAHWAGRADLVLDAMWEPTTTMVIVGEHSMQEAWESRTLRGIWQAMIGAAKVET